METKKEITEEIEGLIKIVDEDTFKTVRSKGYETIKRLIKLQALLDYNQEVIMMIEEFKGEEYTDKEIWEEIKKKIIQKLKGDEK